MDLLSPKHIALILLIVLIVVAGRRLRDIGSPIGTIRSVKAGRPLRLWLALAMMAIAALLFIKFAFRLGY